MLRSQVREYIFSSYHSMPWRWSNRRSAHIVARYIFSTERRMVGIDIDWLISTKQLQRVLGYKTCLDTKPV